MFTKDMKNVEKILTGSGCLRTEGLNTGVQNPIPRTVLLSLCYSEPLQSLVNIPSSYDNTTKWWRTLCSGV